MAVASYTTDLADLSVADAVTNWSAIGTGAISAESDYYIQLTSGTTGCISKVAWGGAIRGQIFNSCSGKTITTPAAYFAWVYYACPNALASEAAGGLQLIIGSGTAAYKHWYVKGADTYTYGGWNCYVVDPSVAVSTTTGAPTTTLQYFGALANVTGAVSKGSPFGVDVIRYGRTLTVTAGDLANGYATFAGAAAVNDATTARWGLFQAIDGGYLQQGLFLMGTAGTAVDFRDSNRTIVIANTKKVAATFNAFEVRNASSRVDWINIGITALGTVSRGNFITTNDAAVTFDTCTFTDMGTFGFLAAGIITDCTFRRCSLVTRGGSNLTNCTFDKTIDTVKALLLRDPSRALSGCTFIKPTTASHAVEITEASATAYTFTNNTFIGYGADGTTSAVIYNNSGGAITINHSGTVGTLTVLNQGASTTTISSSVTITITVKDEANSPINTAFVYVDEDDTAPFVINTTTNASGVATGSYSGASSSGTLRVRKYGYKPFKGTVDLTTTVNQGIVMITDPQQT